MQEKANGKELELHSAVIYTYDSMEDADRALTSIIVRMVDPIDGDSLKKAVEAVSERYSYLNLKRVKRDEKIVYVRRDGGIPCVNQKGGIAIGSKELDGALVAFTYAENEILLEAFHGLMDGYGMNEILRTLVYYYCTARYGVELAVPAAKKVGDKIAEDEYVDILNEPVPGVDYGQLMAMGMGAEGFGMPQNIASIPEQKIEDFQCVHIGISLPQLLKITKESGHSVATLLTAVFNRALLDTYPELEGNIVASQAVSARKAYNGAGTLQNCTAGISLVADDRLKQLDVLSQGPILKTQLQMATKPEALAMQIMMMHQAGTQLEAQPTIAMKVGFLRQAMSHMLASWTYKMSYAGKLNFGEADKYVENVFTMQDNTGDRVTMQIMATDRELCMSYIQDFQNEALMNRFMAILNDMGIPTEVKAVCGKCGSYVKGFEE